MKADEEYFHVMPLTMLLSKGVSVYIVQESYFICDFTSEHC